MASAIKAFILGLGGVALIFHAAFVTNSDGEMFAGGLCVGVALSYLLTKL